MDKASFEALLLEIDERVLVMDDLDYFQILQLEQSASPEEIKAAFYRLSRALHPDRFYQEPSEVLKMKVQALYKRITEAYYVLRDDRKRRRYLEEINGPSRKDRLRFSEEVEAEAKPLLHPSARALYSAALADLQAGRWAQAEQNLKMALAYEPNHPQYREKLLEAQAHRSKR